MQLTYPGPYDAVTLLATGQTATRGVPIEISDDAVAASLVDQGWKPAPTPKTAKAATKKDS